MTSVAHQLQQTLTRLEEARTRAGRPPGAVALLAVSKTFPAEAVREAHAAGQCAFGENYVQEALDKIAALADLRAQLQWHLIGPLQSNKTRPVAAAFDWIHTVDRLKIAQRLAEQRPDGLPPLQLCLQVNISGEDSKSGVAPQDVAALACAVAALPADRVRLRGLMSIPEPVEGLAAQREPHRRGREGLAHGQQRDAVHGPAGALACQADAAADRVEIADNARHNEPSLTRRPWKSPNCWPSRSRTRPPTSICLRASRR